MAAQISGSKSANSFINSIDTIPTDILKDFFSKNENTKNLFNWAKEFEQLGYKKQLINPESIELPLKGILSMTLDFAQIERKKFFNLFPKSMQTSINLEDNNKK